MSLLHYQMSNQVRNPECIGTASSKPDDRFQRDPASDLKEGIDLVFQLKAKIDKFHPIATETLIRLLCM